MDQPYIITPKGHSSSAARGHVRIDISTTRRGHTNIEDEEDDDQQLEEAAGLFEDPVEHVRKPSATSGGNTRGGVTPRGSVTPRGGSAGRGSPRGGALKRRGGGSIDAERASVGKRRNVATEEMDSEDEEYKEVKSEPRRGKGTGRGGRRNK